MPKYRQTSKLIHAEFGAKSNILPDGAVDALRANFMRAWTHLFAAIEWDGLDFYTQPSAHSPMSSQVRDEIIGALLEQGYIEVVSDGS